MRKVLLLVSIMIIMGLTNTFAQAPNTILYQGRLTNPEGAPLLAADVDSVHFYIETGGFISIVLYDTTVTDLTIDNNGVFTVELGPVPETVFSGSKRYLSLKVNTDPVMSPKQLLTSVPYAMNVAGMPGIAHTFQNTDYKAGTSIQAADSITITVPTNGYITVQASGIFHLDHDGIDTYVRASISNSPTTLNYNNFIYYDVASSPAGGYYTPFYVVEAGYVPAGEYKFYLNCNKSSTAGINTSLYKIHILATFYPTDYGTVNSSKTPHSNFKDLQPDGKTPMIK